MTSELPPAQGSPVNPRVPGYVVVSMLNAASDLNAGKICSILIVGCTDPVNGRLPPSLRNPRDPAGLFREGGEGIQLHMI